MFIIFWIYILGIILVLASPPAFLHKSWKVYLRALPIAAFGITLPALTFLGSSFFTPDWKGGCTYGWIDCFHYGKLALAPLVLWATAALYAVEVLRVERRTRAWIVLGISLGALVSIVSTLHGLVTIAFEYKSSWWGMLIPIYVSVWYTARAIELGKVADFKPTIYVYALLGSSPFWVASVILSLQHYGNLPDTPPDCFVATAASRGHRFVVGPALLVQRGVKVQRASAQLVTLWQFEELWRRAFPQSHRAFRRIYNCLGYRASLLIRSRWQADIVCILLKPFELLARLMIWLATRR
jgi:hypothetical protein